MFTGKGIKQALISRLVCQTATSEQRCISQEELQDKFIVCGEEIDIQIRLGSQMDSYYLHKSAFWVIKQYLPDCKNNRKTEIDSRNCSQSWGVGAGREGLDVSIGQQSRTKWIEEGVSD